MENHVIMGLQKSIFAVFATMAVDILMGIHF